MYSFSHTNPYRSIDGLSRTVSVSYRDSTQFVSRSSNFKSQNFAVGLTYGYPISEFQRISGGLSLQRVDLLTYEGSSAQQAVDWVQGNGGAYTREVLSNSTLADGTVLSTATSLFGSRFSTLEANVGWMYDSRNRGLFADRGQRHSLGVAYVPGGSVRYYVASYDGTYYVPLFLRSTLALSMNLAYGNSLGKTTALPPYKRFFGGGPDTVRAFTESSLGPVDSNGNPYGGNLMTVARAEVILPLPVKWQTSARASLFFDYGNVFSTDNVKYLGRDLTTPVDYKFSYDQLRKSAGVAVQWLAPSLGVFRFSYGIPLNKFVGDSVKFADRTENFQFTIGGAF
jgi:outer membrane protein insertion porin family